MEGTITSFDPIKKYGFIAYFALNKSESIFFHIRGFGRFLSPEEQSGLVGKKANFEVGVSPTGRPCAQNIRVIEARAAVSIDEAVAQKAEQQTFLAKDVAKTDEAEDDDGSGEFTGVKEMRRQGYALCKIKIKKLKHARAPKDEGEDISVNPRDYDNGEE